MKNEKITPQSFMKRTLNLVRPEKSDIKFEISKFPDGQQSVTLEGDGRGNFSYLLDEEVTIVSRLNSFLDLEIILCATQALKETGVGKINLYIPYCIGGRSDRKFNEGGFNYIKTVIAPIINSQGYAWVKVLDPHSDVLEACINNFHKITNLDLVRFALEELLIDDWSKTTEDWSFNFWFERVWLENQNLVLVSPDAGAYKKVFDVAKEFKIERIITATKVRDLKTGQIIRTEIPTLDQHNDLKYVIVDDICDGGRTFIELAKAIKDSRPTAEIYLVVTHGIFSSGFTELGKYFNGIYCTNSVKDIVKDSEDTDIEREMKERVKQLNVF